LFQNLGKPDGHYQEGTLLEYPLSQGATQAQSICLTGRRNVSWLPPPQASFYCTTVGCHDNSNNYNCFQGLHWV